MPPNNRQNTLARAEKWANSRFSGIWNLIAPSMSVAHRLENPESVIRTHLMPSFEAMIRNHGSDKVNEMLDLDESGAMVSPILAGGRGSNSSYIFQIDNIPDGVQFDGRPRSMAAVDPLGGKDPFAFDIDNNNRVWFMENPDGMPFILNTVSHSLGDGDLVSPAAALWLGAHRGGTSIDAIADRLQKLAKERPSGRPGSLSMPSFNAGDLAADYLTARGWNHSQSPPMPNNLTAGTETIHEAMFGDKSLDTVSHEAFTGLLSARFVGGGSGLPNSVFVRSGDYPYEKDDIFNVFLGLRAVEDRFQKPQRYLTELISQEEAPPIMRPRGF